MRNSFFLVIPAQAYNADQAAAYDARALEHWLNDLPTANPGLATKLVHDFLIGFNAVKLSSSLRLEALEQVRPKVLVIEEYLQSRLMRSAFPKQEDEIKILEVLVAIQRELAIGYWTVLKELSSKPVGWFQTKNLVLALQRCVRGLVSIVLSRYIMNLPAPDWVWIDLHSLFKLSVKLRKDNVKVPDVTSINKSISTGECYLQILLLTLTKPTRLMPKEISIVFNFIENLIPYVNLSSRAVLTQTTQFLIMTDEDKPPRVQMEMHTAKDVSALYINLTKLHKILENKHKLAATTHTRFASMHVLKNHEEKPALELVNYLEQSWRGVEPYKAAQFDDRLDRYMAIGMALSHSLKNRELAEEKYTLDTDNETEILVHSQSETLLHGNFEKPGIISVGNLVSYRKSDSPPEARCLGIINEVVIDKKNKLSFGLNVIASAYEAVHYTLAAAQDGNNLYKGLLYTSDYVPQTTYIIIDNMMVKEGDTVKMTLHHDSVFLLLKDKKNVGLGYWQFECHRIAAKVAEKSSTSTNKGYDFIN